MKQTGHSRSFALPLLALLVINHHLTTPLGAATNTVSNTDDSGDESLRQAILSAASGDTINFAVTGTIVLTTGELLVTNDLAFVGPGAVNLAISGSHNGRVFEIGSNASVSISGLTIRGGHAPDGAVAGARGTNGGGIYNAGTLALTSCALSGNSGGNASTIFSLNIAVGGRGGAGGAIYSEGSLRLTACTVSGNAAGAGGLGASSGAGGTGGGIHNAGTLVLLNCTLSSNAAGPGGFGTMNPQGAVGGSGGAVYSAGSLTLTACTVSSNRAGQGSFPKTGGTGGNGGDGGGICNATNAPFAKVSSTLLASNSVGPGGPGTSELTRPGAPGIGPDLYGVFTSQGHNLVGVPVYWAGFTNGVNNDLVGPLDPLLGPLQDNGGSMPTMALLPGSRALAAGDDALLGAPLNLTTDQRGLPRKSGGHVDIGAFEAQVADTPVHLDGPAMFGNGAFGFTFASTPGASFSVLASTNAALPLGDWTVLGGVSEISPGQFQFTDDQVPSYARRYYRVRAL